MKWVYRTPPPQTAQTARALLTGGELSRSTLEDSGGAMGVPDCCASVAPKQNWTVQKKNASLKKPGASWSALLVLSHEACALMTLLAVTTAPERRRS